MTAAHLWVFLPIFLGMFTFLFQSARGLHRWGTLIALGLAFLAWFVPLDTPLRVAGMSFKVSATFEFLGRSLVFDKQMGYVLLLLYGITAMWFYGLRSVPQAREIVPWGFLFNGLLVVLLTVRPFLYAAIVLEALGFLLVFLIRPPAKSVLRFLAHQTLAFPLLLLAASLGTEGTFLSDPQRGPLALALLGVGLALSAGLFPFHTWMPLLGAELHPYLSAFLLWLLPFSTLLFLSGFIERFLIFAALRLPMMLQVSGMLMALVGSGGMLVERHWGRALGYAVMVETGYALLALSLGAEGASLMLASLLPRSLTFVLWGFALSILYRHSAGLEQGALEGMGHRLPIATLALALAVFSVAGFPMLAAFPWRLSLWEGLSADSSTLGFLFLLSLLGIFGHGLRTFHTLFSRPTGWQIEETLGELILLILGIFGIALLGLFPQLIGILLGK